MFTVRAFLLAALILAAVPAQAFLGFFSGHREVRAENGLVSIPLADVPEGKASYFRFVDGGVELDFFVFRTPDGAVRTAFDACDVCYHARKGYSQDKEFMVCNNCGMKFHSSRVGDVEGGCNPSPLKRDVEGETILISTASLAEGKRYFK